MSQSIFIKVEGAGTVEGGWKLPCIIRSERAKDGNKQKGKTEHTSRSLSLSLVSIRLFIIICIMCLKQLDAKEKLM
jgi:hypothetical protein